MPTYAAVMPPLVYLFSFLHEPSNYANHWLANFAFLPALFLLVRHAEKPSSGRSFWAGILISMAGMTLQTFGVILLLTGIVAVLPNRRYAGYWLLGVSLGAAPWFLYLAYHQALAAFWNDVISSNLYRSGSESVNPGTFLRLSLNQLFENPGYLPIFLLLFLPPILGFVGPLVEFRKNKPSPPVLVIYIASILMMLHCFYRLLESQLLMHHFLSVVMTFWWLSQIPSRKLSQCLMVLPVLLALPSAYGYLDRQFQSERVWLELPQGRTWTHTAREAESLAQLRDFLDNHLQPGEPVLLLPYVPNLYFLMDLEHATRYSQLRSRQYSREQMAEVLEDLRAQSWPKVIYFPIYESEQFLWANWPDQPPELYYQQRDWFHSLLFEHYRKRDFGALWLLEP